MEQKLRRLLDELSAAIGRSNRDEDREELTRLQGDVEGHLSGGEPEEEHSGLIDRLEAAETRFETDHPTLGRALRETIEVLSAAGL